GEVPESGQRAPGCVRYLDGVAEEAKLLVGLRYVVQSIVAVVIPKRAARSVHEHLGRTHGREAIVVIGISGPGGVALTGQHYALTEIKTEQDPLPLTKRIDCRRGRGRAGCCTLIESGKSSCAAQRIQVSNAMELHHLAGQA